MVKTKRLLTFGLVILAMFIMITGVNAQIYMPMPINIHVDITDTPLEIKVTNLRTGISKTVFTNNAGQAVIDWSNTDDKGGTIQKWIIGDQMKAVIINCEDNSACTEEFILTQPEALVTFDLDGVSVICDTCEDTTCEPKLCPTDYTPYTREDCEDLIDCGTIDPAGISWEQIGGGLAIGLIIALVGFMGGGIKIYKKRLGGVAFLHRHRGIRGYHNPDTSHKNTSYKHRRWSDDPFGCISDVKKMEEEGGL